MAAYVCSWAAGRKFEVVRDAVGNVCVRVPARPGGESAPTVVLQSHLDIVCERDSGCPYDAAEGRIHVVRDGDWLRAEGTTLGADNGIGGAAMMHLAELDDLRRGPLELLFTLDEERGLVGARNLDPALVRGRILLNLDSEDDGILVVGCSGGRGSTLTWTDRREAPSAGWTQAEVRIGGLLGGHSGLEIDKGRLNALRALARVLIAARRDVPFRLSTLGGGDKTNAIPRESWATLAYAAADEARLRTAIAQSQADLLAQYRGRDDGFTVAFQPAKTGSTAAPFSDEGSSRLLSMLCAIPCGVLALSPDIPGLVETSNNLGVIRTSGDAVEIRCSSRSSVPGSLRDVLDSIHAAARLGGAAIEESEGYPGWKPNMSSRVLEVSRKTFERIYERPPAVTAIHAGLECGLIGERIADMDMLSLGPEIKGVHAPGERVQISSVRRFFELLKAIVQDLAR